MSATPFRLLGPDHLIGLALIFAVAALGAVRGPVLSTRARMWIRNLLGALITGVVVANYARLAVLQHLSIQYNLPLHLCDLTVGVCALAIFTRHRFAAELCYYWGMVGAVQALLTPDLRLGFPALPFILFFLAHGLIVWTNVWLIWVEGLRPRPGSVGRAFLALIAWSFIVGGINWLLKANYGYLCRRPAGASLLDLLGPWPWYIIVGELLAGLGFCLLYLPWRKGPGAVKEARSG